MRQNSTFLQQLIHRWDHARKTFRVGHDSWYRPIEEDIYFIIGISRRGEDWPQFPKFPISISIESHLIYVQRYVSTDIVEPTEFQVAGGQLQIDSFGREEVKCLSLIETTLEHYTFNGKLNNFP